MSKITISKGLVTTETQTSVVEMMPKTREFTKDQIKKHTYKKIKGFLGEKLVTKMVEEIEFINPVDEASLKIIIKNLSSCYVVNFCQKLFKTAEINSIPQKDAEETILGGVRNGESVYITSTLVKQNIVPFHKLTYVDKTDKFLISLIATNHVAKFYLHDMQNVELETLQKAFAVVTDGLMARKQTIQKIIFTNHPSTASSTTPYVVKYLDKEIEELFAKNKTIKDLVVNGLEVIKPLKSILKTSAGLEVIKPLKSILKTSSSYIPNIPKADAVKKTLTFKEGTIFKDAGDSTKTYKSYHERLEDFCICDITEDQELHQQPMGECFDVHSGF